MSLKNFLIKLHWLLSSEFGFDPRRFIRSVWGIPLFLRDWRRFRRGCSDKLMLMPCFHDRYEEGGTTKGEYFWQDLLVARWIHDARPQHHVDVGSLVNVFVAHVASFREIEVFDVRPITAQIPGVVFKQADLMQPVALPSADGGGYCDSLSCLHAIEHFGLGRYGDPIDPRGHERGIANMAQLLKPDGRFYLSTPIGWERVEFNAHRVFDPRTIIRCAESSGLRLRELIVIGAGGVVRQVQPNPDTLLELAQSRYNLGVFVFIKRGYSPAQTR
ncbi:MAG: DUF268 domain-containing protein [Pseudomonadota bacterium]